MPFIRVKISISPFKGAIVDNEKARQEEMTQLLQEEEKAQLRKEVMLSRLRAQEGEDGTCDASSHRIMKEDQGMDEDTLRRFRQFRRDKPEYLGRLNRINEHYRDHCLLPQKDRGPIEPMAVEIGLSGGDSKIGRAHAEETSGIKDITKNKKIVEADPFVDIVPSTVTSKADDMQKLAEPWQCDE